MNTIIEKSLNSIHFILNKNSKYFHEIFQVKELQILKVIL